MWCLGEIIHSSTRLSVALSFGSPVFRKMLPSNLKEDQDLSATGHVELPLEDDLQSMITMCRALHLQHKAVMVQPSSDDLLDVAALQTQIPGLCLECVLEGETWKKKDCTHTQGSSSPFGVWETQPCLDINGEHTVCIQCSR
ncbi:hypothetical protein BST61_g2179 [Cercospora zeina]